MLEFNQCQKSDKAPFIFYANLKCSTEKIDEFKINRENSSTAKVDNHIPLDFLMVTLS